MAQLPFAVIPLALESIATGNERSERPASHLGEFKHIGMVWQTNGSSAIWVRGGSATPKTIDFVGILLANATPATTLRVRLDNSVITSQNGIYDTGNIPFISPAIARDDGLYCSHLELPSPVTAGYWRFDIGSVSGDFSAAKLILGRKLTPATYYNGDFERGIEDLGSLEMSRWGVSDETPGLIYRSLALKFGWLSEADYEDKFARIANTLGKRSPLFFCFDPTSDRHRQNKSYFGPLKKLPYATGGPMPGKIQTDFQLLSALPGSYSEAIPPVFDFSGGVLPAGATLARSTTGTYTNLAGNVATAAIDAARFDYDPITHALRGLLIEPAGTNNMTNSEDITVATVVNGAWTANDRAAPDGATTADKFVASAAGSRFQKFGFLTQSALNTHGLWLFATTAVSGNIVIFDSGGGTGGVTVPFTLTPNVWTRLSVTGTPTGTDRRCWVEFPTGTPTVWAWGWQSEQAAALSSYIPTAGSAVTRAADVLTLDWGSKGVIHGTYTLRYTFDDGSTQTAITTIPGGIQTVPTNLNRRCLLKVEKI